MDELNVEDQKQTAEGSALSDAQIAVLCVEFGKLEMNPGDVLLVRVDSRVLAQEGARENISEAIQKVFPKGTPWLLHDEYADFAVVNPTGALTDDTDTAPADTPPADDGDDGEGSEGAEVPQEAEAEHV